MLERKNARDKRQRSEPVLNSSEESSSLFVTRTKPNIVLFGPSDLDREVCFESVTFGVVKFPNVPFRERSESCCSRGIRH